MNDLGLAQALFDQVEMQLRGGNPLGGFFLERVQDIQHSLEANRVDGAICLAAGTFANLKNAATKSLKRLRASRMVAELASKSACPISRRAMAEKACKSGRLDPTKTAGLILRSNSFTAI